MALEILEPKISLRTWRDRMYHRAQELGLTPTVYDEAMRVLYLAGVVETINCPALQIKGESRP